MIDVEELEKRFDEKLEEYQIELPKKYTAGKIVSQNCAMLTMRGFLEIIGKEDENYINMAAPLAALTDTCGAVNAGLMITGLITGKFGEKEVHQLKASEEGMRFLKTFEQYFGSCHCQVLTGGYNLLTLKGMQNYLNDKIWEKKCYKYVVLAIEIIKKLYKRKIARLI